MLSNLILKLIQNIVVIVFYQVRKQVFPCLNRLHAFDFGICFGKTVAFHFDEKFTQNVANNNVISCARRLSSPALCVYHFQEMEECCLTKNIKVVKNSASVYFANFLLSLL